MDSIPPGPKGHFLLGNLPEFAGDILGFFRHCGHTYGDVVSVRLAAWPVVFINHPDHVENVLLTNNRHFIKHTFFWRHVTDIFGQGLVTNEGAPWLRQRRLMQPAFHRERIAAYGATMAALTGEMLESWDRQNGGPRDIHEDMMSLTMEIASRTLFGAGLPAETRAEISAVFDDAIVEIAHRFRRPMKIPRWFPLPSNRRYAKAVARIDRLIYDIIEQKRAENRDASTPLGAGPSTALGAGPSTPLGAGGNDLLSMLLDARDEEGRPMDDRQIRDEAVTIFLAGHETTAIALSWTFYLLARHPEVERRAVQEISEVVGDRLPATADLARLPFLSNVVNESLRLYPPAYAIGREAIDDCEIGGFPVRAGTTIFMSPWLMHRDPRWFDDPLTFCPERWENDLAKRLPRYAYLPFGGGPRVCIGNSFALMEAALVLATVLGRYRLTQARAETVEPFPSITLRPHGGMPMIATARF